MYVYFTITLNNVKATNNSPKALKVKQNRLLSQKPSKQIQPQSTTQQQNHLHTRHHRTRRSFSSGRKWCNGCNG